MMQTVRDTREAVRERYAQAARSVSEGKPGCCGPSDASCGCGTDVPDACGDRGFGPALYLEAQREELPEAAKLASLGCGNPTAIAELHEGDVVLDLGSGGGIDVLLSAKRVGLSGKAYGLDMTDEMLELARHNQREAGVENADFLTGTIEEIPLPDASVDVVISNCVINLSADKPEFFTRRRVSCGRAGGWQSRTSWRIRTSTQPRGPTWSGGRAASPGRSRARIPPRAGGGRLHRHRDRRDPPRARLGRLRDRPRR
jgi:SAM-dependent methyltransferase